MWNRNPLQTDNLVLTTSIILSDIVKKNKLLTIFKWLDMKKTFLYFHILNNCVIRYVLCKVNLTIQ